MAERSAAPPVVDEPENSRFVIHVDGTEAELTYRQRAGRLILVHTGVPESLSGQGLAGQLVRTAVERAAREGLTVAPWCPYVRNWLEKHPDEAATIEIDWTPPPQPS